MTGVQTCALPISGKVSLKIPPGTPSAKTFRVKGKGFPRLGGYGSGDLFIKVVVDVPEHLSHEQKELLKKFDAIGGETPLKKEYKEKLKHLKR